MSSLARGLRPSIKQNPGRMIKRSEEMPCIDQTHNNLRLAGGWHESSTHCAMHRRGIRAFRTRSLRHCFSGPRSPAVQRRVSPGGEDLYQYEALIHQMFGNSISVCTGSGGCHQGWLYRGSLFPLAEYSPFTYAFSGFGCPCQLYSGVLHAEPWSLWHGYRQVAGDCKRWPKTATCANYSVSLTKPIRRNSNSQAGL